jgi:hypothetical protein
MEGYALCRTASASQALGEPGHPQLLHARSLRLSADQGRVPDSRVIALASALPRHAARWRCPVRRSRPQSPFFLMSGLYFCSSQRIRAGLGGPQTKRIQQKGRGE